MPSDARPSHAEAWPEREWDVGERVGTVVPRSLGGMVIAGDSGFRFLAEAGGPLGTPWPTRKRLPDNRFNDGKCSPDGRFFAGSISLSQTPRRGHGSTGSTRIGRCTKSSARSPTRTASVGRRRRDGLLHRHPRREVFAFDYDSGRLLAMRSAVRHGEMPGVPGRPCGRHGGPLVDRLLPRRLRRVLRSATGQTNLHKNRCCPACETTACAFGGVRTNGFVCHHR